MARVVAVSDIHGDIDGLEKCLIEAKIISKSGNRMTDDQHRAIVIALGDVATCAKETIDGDIKCLQKVGDWIDIMLMGNHEIPYFDRRNCFSGFYFDERVEKELERIESEKLLKPVYRKGETLLSHAGWDQDNHPFVSNAQEARAYIDLCLIQTGWSHPIFANISHTRGGMSKHGGILWEDFRDLRSPFPQIVGHTSDYRIRYKKNAICIDTNRFNSNITVVEVQ